MKCLESSPQTRPGSYGRGKAAAIILLLAFCTACQPAVEERMQRATAFAAEGDYRSASLELKNVVREQPDNIAAREMLAKANYQLADFTAAQVEYRRVLELGGDNPEIWVGLGRALLGQSKPQEAFEIVVPNLDEETATEEALVLMGDIYLTLGNDSEARRLFDDILNKNPDSAYALVGLGVIEFRRNKVEQSDELINQAVERNPSSDFAWRSRGNYLRLRRNLASAEEAFERAIELESSETTLADRLLTRANLISVLVDSRKLTLAEELIIDLRKQFPPYPLMDYLTGRLAFAKGELKAAQDSLQKYIAAVPSDLRGKAVLGATNFSQENYYQAEMYLIEAVRANVGGQTTRKLLAETQLRLNKPGEALEALRVAEEAGQSDATLLSMLGRAELGVGDTDAAIRYFERSLESAPDNATVGLALAISYMQAGRLDDAIKLLDSLPSSSNTNFRREILIVGGYLQRGDPDQAIAETEKLVSANPQNAEALSIAGVLRQTLGEFDQARNYFDRALALDEDNLAALFSLARIDLAEEDFEAAERRLKRLLEKYPKYVPALAILGGLLEERGRVAEIRPWLEKSIVEAPDSLSPYILLIRLELNAGNFDAAEAEIDKARQTFPGEAVLDNLLGRLMLNRDQTREGIGFLRSAATQDPDSPRFNLDLAKASLRYGDVQTAARAARIYHDLRPDDVDGLQTLVSAELRSARAQDVRNDVLAFMARMPDQPEAKIMLGDIEMALDNPRQAIIHYEQAAQSIQNGALVIQQARAHRQAGTGRAPEVLRSWLEANPEDAEPRIFYAQLLELSGDLEKAIAQYELLVDQGTDSPIVYNNLAWQYALQGNPKALKLAERAHELAPDDGGISDTLGWIYFNSGQVNEAVRVLEQAVLQSPTDPEIRYHLARALIAAGGDRGREMLSALMKSGEGFPSREEAAAFLANEE